MTAGHKRILITGAAGAIGSTLRAGLRNTYRLLRVSDVRSLGGSAAGEETIEADLTDLAAVRRIVKGIDCVVHLGGVPREDTWGAICENNIAGTYNLFEASRECGVKSHCFRELYTSQDNAEDFAARFADPRHKVSIRQSNAMAAHSVRSI